jgi:hypothetical protein
MKSPSARTGTSFPGTWRRDGGIMTDKKEEIAFEVEDRDAAVKIIREARTRYASRNNA